jgi:site-specific recombinase
MSHAQTMRMNNSIFESNMKDLVDFIRSNLVSVFGFILIVANIRSFLTFNYNFEVKFIHCQTNMMSMV